MKKFLRNNGLSIVLFGLFFLSLAGLSVAGLHYQNEELHMHGQQPIAYWQYLGSGDFIEAVFENWESEFLQMGALVLLTIWLFQKGSEDSKKLKGKEPQDVYHSRYSIIHAATASGRVKAIGSVLYANSLSITLFALFFVSFLLHAWGGAEVFNEQALQHGGKQLGVWQYITTSQFWFESFQNWQSEFFSIGVLIVLSIYLRQVGSPQSKPVNDSNSTTHE